MAEAGTVSSGPHAHSAVYVAAQKYLLCNQVMAFRTTNCGPQSCYDWSSPGREELKL